MTYRLDIPIERLYEVASEFVAKEHPEADALKRYVLVDYYLKAGIITAMWERAQREFPSQTKH